MKIENFGIMHQYLNYLHYYPYCLLTLMVNFETKNIVGKVFRSPGMAQEAVTRAGRSCKLMRIFTVIVTTSAQLTL